MIKYILLVITCISFHTATAQCLASTNPTNDCSGGAAISFINLHNVATYPGGCITSDGYWYNSNSPYGLMIGAPINYTINTGITLAVAMWIDLNNDAILTSNEMLFSSSPKQLHIGTFTVPKTATPFSSGKIRFRSAWNHQILGSEACVNDLGGAGDTQDYLISLFCGTLSIPAINITPATPKICKGGNITLTASGANNYTWSPSNATSPGINVTPSVSTLYTVTGSNTNCPGSSKKTVMVTISNPVVNVSASKTLICVGESNTLTAEGAVSYSWSTQESGSGIVIVPTAAGQQSYVVTGTDGTGCKKTVGISIEAEECVGLADYRKIPGDLSFFPNPAAHVIIFKGIFPQPIKIINARGQTVIETMLNDKKEIFIGHLQPGIYLVNNGFITRKLVVIN